MQITPAVIQNWAAIFQAAVALGLTTKNGIAGLVKTLAPGKSDEELNAIVEGVIADADRREALAASDVAAMDAKTKTED